MEVGRADALSHAVVVVVGGTFGARIRRHAAHETHLVALHDLLELLAHLAHLPQRLLVHEVSRAPGERVAAFGNEILYRCSAHMITVFAYIYTTYVRLRV